jgi:benzoate transport porin
MTNPTCKTGILVTALTSLLPLAAHADFAADSSLKLDLKNFYLDRSYSGSTDGVGSWSQGFDLQFTSGYTSTTVQVGLDASGQTAYTLDSEGNDGSLPYKAAEQDTSDQYGRAGATLKLKYSKTELKIGDYRPHLPIAWDDTSRQLDTIYEGAVLESREIDKLNLIAGRFWQAVTRQSSDKEDLYLWGSNGSKRSDGLDFAGATYDVTPGLQGSYYIGILNDIYKQQYLGFSYKTRFGDMASATDVRYFKNAEDGDALNGEIDNRALGLKTALMSGGHMLALSYQKMNGDSIFPTMNGYIPQPYLVNWSSTGFVRPDERSIGIAYAYDFKDVGAPGLKVFSRYIKGTGVDVGSETNASESEKNLYLSYSLQNGTLKGLTFDLRNIRVAKSFAADYNEYRFITTYTVNF